MLAEGETTRSRLRARPRLHPHGPYPGSRQPSETLATLVLSPAEPDPSLSPHQLDAAPPHHLIADNSVVPETAPQPLMMAQPVPHQTPDKRRVKVYELRHNDWFDRGTGFCYACYVLVEEGQPKEPRVVVESEDQPNRRLLETKIVKDDGFQKQQGMRYRLLLRLQYAAAVVTVPRV